MSIVSVAVTASSSQYGVLRIRCSSAALIFGDLSRFIETEYHLAFFLRPNMRRCVANFPLPLEAGRPDFSLTPLSLSPSSLHRNRGVKVRSLGREKRNEPSRKRKFWTRETETVTERKETKKVNSIRIPLILSEWGSLQTVGCFPFLVNRKVRPFPSLWGLSR